ncbi:hypothetical protein LTR78_004789 [Recurvomyces mirabilis]|uniref:Heterokaryon incompatibility domain-containing protein n=1 Tax=Recurvomyces mirabilis TaxID=574656 RepID=A0AAE0WNY9_9PEZI|nr:hypothetical protein LTR78_004789 [Recurvomyces mirabilis]KAK5157960.1 hypothetical protein LTS14_003883 [Recurvomyces mirabilis]
MRLLHTSSLVFQEFFDEHTPSYAILSHRWGEQEVSYADFLAGRKQDHAGHIKVLNACRIASSNRHDWMWIDTICIDKTSSAELTEAINSMFEWYARSQIYYVYLRDVPPELTAEQTNNAFQRSEWFSRGWTLQELLVPKHILFLNSAWKSMGTKSELSPAIHQATKIPEWYLQRPDQICFASVASRMSWAARRTTTRSEDVAYSLLGIFNINMPLLYGERGHQAFFRLQLEIAKASDDESIFAWTSPTNEPCGMFAPWPSAFAGSGDVKSLHLPPEDRIPWKWTNKGLQLYLASPLNTKASMTMGNSLMDHTKPGEPHKLVTLGCFKSDVDVDMRDAKALRAAMKGRIVLIELQRMGAR